MHLTVQHTRLFRTVYRSPQQRYILSCIFISIEYRIAVITSEFLTLSISYMETIRASLACICRWYIYQFNAIKQTLVSKETSKLIKVPFTYSCSKFFTFLVSRKSNTLQVLNGLKAMEEYADQFKSSPIDWQKLREKYFAECTITMENRHPADIDIVISKYPTVCMAPHDLFE